MLRPRWRKLLRDLAHSPSRTVLVVLSIAVGVFAFGTILAARVVLVRELRASYLGINPASATITSEPFESELIDAVRRVPGVAQAEARRAVAARVQVTVSQWQDTTLLVLPDDGQLTVGIVSPERGAWPPPKHGVLIERSSLPKMRAAVGDTLHIELAGQAARELPLAGLTHDLSLPPAAIAGQAFGYVSLDTLEWLGGPRNYNQIQIVVAGDRSDKAHIQEVANRVEHLLEQSGRLVLNTDVPTPLQHPAEVVLPVVLGLLTTLGLLALLISGFLIINTISAILAQQTRQIGVMKAIGARADQLAGLYVALAGAFGLLALLLAVPLAALGAYGLTNFIGGQLNLDLQGWRLPLPVIGLQAAAALLVPIVTAALPIRAVVRRPAREALSGETAAPPEHSPLDRLLARLHGLSRPTRLALRNTFRRRGRLVRTLLALSLGGGVFVTVLTLRASLGATLDTSIASQRYDVEVQFSQLYRDRRAALSAGAVPGITSVESLLRTSAVPVHNDGSTGEALIGRALPASTTLFAPRMTSGRWLLPNDGRAVVLTTNYLTKERATQLGDWITLEIGNSEERWQIVGFVEELLPPTSPAWAYVPIDAYTELMGSRGRTDTLRIATAGHDTVSHQAAVQALETQLAADGFELRLIRSRSEDRAILSERFNLLTAILSLMALLIGGVGGLGLTGTMSINVLERTPEIGVMRAIGASNRAISQIVLSEGVTIGAMAWLLGAVLSLPMSLAMCYGLGMTLLNTPLLWVYSLPGLAIWLVVVLVLAALASLLPARAATRLTVREVLAYE